MTPFQWQLAEIYPVNTASSTDAQRHIQSPKRWQSLLSKIRWLIVSKAELRSNRTSKVPCLLSSAAVLISVQTLSKTISVEWWTRVGTADGLGGMTTQSTEWWSPMAIGLTATDDTSWPEARLITTSRMWRESVSGHQHAAVCWRSQWYQSACWTR